MQTKVVAVGIFAIALAVASFFGPWWAVQMESSGAGGTTQSVLGYGILGTTYTTQTPSGIQTSTGNYTYAPDTRGMFLVAAVLTGSAAIAGTGLVAACAVRGSRPRSRSVAATLGMIAFVLLLAAVLYSMAQLPLAVNLDNSRIIGVHGMVRGFYSGFWGSQSYNTATGTFILSFGAGWAWYAVLLATVLFFVGSLMLSREPSEAAAARTASSAPTVPP